MRIICNLQKPKVMNLNVKKIKENMNITTILKIYNVHARTTSR